MSRAAAAARRELQAILRSRPLLTALFLVPGFAILLIAAMLSRGALEALPVALVARSPRKAVSLLPLRWRARPRLTRNCARAMHGPMS